MALTQNNRKTYSSGPVDDNILKTSISVSRLFQCNKVLSKIIYHMLDVTILVVVMSRTYRIIFACSLFFRVIKCSMRVHFKYTNNENTAMVWEVMTTLEGPTINNNWEDKLKLFLPCWHSWTQGHPLPTQGSFSALFPPTSLFSARRGLCCFAIIVRLIRELILNV